jgi:catechol 2,3-dioxygenase-like lactoylglutathione lyase family enzyme
VSVTHAKVVSVPVSDQDHARDFYVDVLGFELVADTPMGPGMR